jgi:hypothetical protein
VQTFKQNQSKSLEIDILKKTISSDIKKSEEKTDQSKSNKDKSSKAAETAEIN